MSTTDTHPQFCFNTVEVLLDTLVNHLVRDKDRSFQCHRGSIRQSRRGHTCQVTYQVSMPPWFY